MTATGTSLSCPLVTPPNGRRTSQHRNWVGVCGGWSVLFLYVTRNRLDNTSSLHRHVSSAKRQFKGSGKAKVLHNDPECKTKGWEKIKEEKLNEQKPFFFSLKWISNFFYYILNPKRLSAGRGRKPEQIEGQTGWSEGWVWRRRVLSRDTDSSWRRLCRTRGLLMTSLARVPPNERLGVVHRGHIKSLRLTTPPDGAVWTVTIHQSLKLINRPQLALLRTD